MPLQAVEDGGESLLNSAGQPCGKVVRGYTFTRGNFIGEQVYLWGKSGTIFRPRVCLQVQYLLCNYLTNTMGWGLVA